MTKQQLIQKLIEYMEKHQHITDPTKLYYLNLSRGICYLSIHEFKIDIYAEPWLRAMVEKGHIYIGGKSIERDPINGIKLRIHLLKKELEDDKARVDLQDN